MSSHLVPSLTFILKFVEEKLASSHLCLSPRLTGEVQKMLEEQNVSLSNVEPAPIDEM